MLFIEAEFTNVLLYNGLEGENGEPDNRLPGVAEACCGVGENPTANLEVDSGEAE